MCSQAAKVPWVNLETAAEALRALASTDGDLTDEPTFVEWTGKASAVLRPIFGAASVQVGEFEADRRLTGFRTRRRCRRS
jgi:hypothetical protein